jgi:hypothetical protein
MGTDVRIQITTSMLATARFRDRVCPSCLAMRGTRGLPSRRVALTNAQGDLNTFVEITTSDYSPALKGRTLLRGFLFLMVTTRVGRIGLGTLGGAIWFVLAAL